MVELVFNYAIAFSLSKFPGEVQSNEEIMHLLSVSTTRIEHMQVRLAAWMEEEGNRWSI